MAAANFSLFLGCVIASGAIFIDLLGVAILCLVFRLCLRSIEPDPEGRLGTRLRQRLVSTAQ